MARRILFLLLVLLAGDTSLAGPFTPSRFVVVAPKLRPSGDRAGARFLTKHGIWANLQKGFHSAADRFGWSIAFGGILEFVSWPGSSITMQGDIEVLADTRNDIGFNPQGVNWEEGFLYNIEVDKLELAAGYMHRCMHNVDNLLTTNPDARNMQRTLIYGSLTTRALMRDIRLKGVGTTSAWLGADYYLVKEDYRYPDQEIKIKPDVANLQASVDGGFQARIIGRGGASFYTRMGGKLAFYSDTTITNYRVEVGLAFSGEEINMQVFAGGEGISDDGGSVIPRETNFFYVGIRFLGKNIAL